MPIQRSIHLQDESYRQLAEQFYKQLGHLGYNAQCNTNRYYNLMEFLQWLENENKHQLSKIQAIDIQNYHRYISNRTNQRNTGVLSPKSVHAHMQLVNRFFIFLEQSKTIQANPCSALVFPYPKEKRCERLILTKEEIKLLYQSAENAQQRAILSLAYGCGLRAEELQNCNCEDIRLQEKIIIIPKGKGNKKRVVPLSKGVIKDLSEYYYHHSGKSYDTNEITLNSTMRLCSMHEVAG